MNVSVAVAPKNVVNPGTGARMTLTDVGPDNRVTVVIADPPMYGRVIMSIGAPVMEGSPMLPVLMKAPLAEPIIRDSEVMATEVLALRILGRGAVGISMIRVASVAVPVGSRVRVSIVTPL